MEGGCGIVGIKQLRSWVHTSLFRVAVNTDAARPGMRTIGRHEGEQEGAGGGGAANARDVTVTAKRARWSRRGSGGGGMIWRG